MDWTTLIIQLGISGLVVFAGFKIAMRSIDHGRASDAERTKVIAAGFDAIIQRGEARHESVTTLLNDHQTNELQLINGIVNALTRLDARVDMVLDLTPIREMQRAHAVANAEGDNDQAIEPPEKSRPHQIPHLPTHRETPNRGVPRLPSSSEYVSHLRPKKG